MASSVNAIPLECGSEDEDVLGVATDPGRKVKDAGVRSSLAMQDLGLLAVPQAGVDEDRRIADWIASQLDLALAEENAPHRRNVWNQLIDRLPAAAAPRAAARRRGGAETAFADWSRFRIAYRRGITVVRLIDLALVKERDVRELTRDLIELIEAGNHRLLLNFQGIERVASWVALAVDEAYRRAKAADGGELKICGLSDSLAAVLEIAGMAPGIERFTRTRPRRSTPPWPEPSTPRDPRRSTSCSP